MEKWLGSYSTLVLDFKEEFFRLASDFLTSSDLQKINQIGQILYTNLFHSVPTKRYEITAELIIHISSGTKDEPHYALKGTFFSF